MSAWQLQEAKASFSAVVREAQTHGPQMITVRGETKVVVLAIKDYNRLKNFSKKPSLVELMRQSPLHGLDLEFKRDRSLPREEDLF